MKKGCFIVLFVLLILIGFGSYWIYSNRESLLTWFSEAFESPSHATKEAIESQHGEFLDQLREAATSSGSLFTFGSKVEKLEYPNTLVYIGVAQIENEDLSLLDQPDPVPVYQKIKWKSYRLTSNGNYGWGSLTCNEGLIKIISYVDDGPWEYMDRFIVYFEHTEIDSIEAQNR